MMFFPLIDNISNWVLFKTQGTPMPDDYYSQGATWFLIAIYFIVAYMLYQS
jgi:hypothetical protein